MKNKEIEKTDQVKESTKRKILFRGKRVDDGKWVCGYFVQALDAANTPIKNCIIENLSKTHVVEGTTVQDYHNVISETVSQFTGLCDKNGTKIFEGDIVQYIYAREQTGSKFEVKFVNERGGWYPFANGDGCGCCETETFEPSCYGIVDNMAVIGNIHDNPELLR